MTTFIVDDSTLSNDPNDGRTSLREAIEAANAHEGSDKIRFAPGLAEAYAGDCVVTEGESLEIDDDTNGDGLPDLRIVTVADGPRAWYVGDGARLKLTKVDLFGTVAGSDRGLHAMFENHGHLSLEGSVIEASIQGRFGDDGAPGASAKDLGFALAGFDGSGANINGGHGSHGVDAGDGGSGTDGGNAGDAALFRNWGTISLEDVFLEGGVQGGAGGDGGDGGDGGKGETGGKGGDTAFVFAVTAGHGGDGGDGGDGGNGGDGGDGGDAYLMLGEPGAGGVEVRAGLASDLAVWDGAGGDRGGAGAGGARGGGGGGGLATGASLAKNGLPGSPGSDGRAGVAGASGTNGPAHPELRPGETPERHGALVYAYGAAASVREGQSLEFSIIRLGDGGHNFTVDWEIVSRDGVGFADLAGSQRMKGSVTFADDEQDLQRVILGVVGDGRSEGLENFEFRISNVTPTGADSVGLGTDTVEGGILDANGGLTRGDDRESFWEDRDLVRGLGGNDRIHGGAGGDRLFGNAGNDRLLGGEGNDHLWGGRGRDNLAGNEGRDVFHFAAAADSGPGRSRDIVRDFDRRESDRIDFRKIDADLGRGGDQSFELIGRKGFTDTAGELRYSKSNGALVVAGDVDGDGAADFQIEVHGAGRLAAADFIL